MTSAEKILTVQPRPVTLGDGSEITIAVGMLCSTCGDYIRAIDAEPLERGGVRLVCSCGHLILQHEQGTRT
jgi:hypothetical protein